MEIVAFIFSVISFFISIIIAYVGYKKDYDLTKISLESVFYNDIFKEYLIQKIPKARAVIWIDPNRKLRDISDLIMVLNNLRQDSLYFSYNNKSFYNKLKNACQSLEDYLTNQEDGRIAEEDETIFFDKVHNDITAIYDTIFDSLYRQIPEVRITETGPLGALFAKLNSKKQ